jgi:hypothetical protein
VDVLAAQFLAGDFNIGVACGPQPNGVNLVVIDVDVRDDGLARWAAMIEEHDIPPTAMHITPSGGLHVFFDAGDLGLSNSKLAPGIDVRGLGGQVVVPPSSRMINGQQAHYTHKGKGLSLNRHPVAPLPEWLAEMLVRPSRVEVQASAARHPSQGGGVVTNADWLADHWSWPDVLLDQGYEIVGRRGDEVYVRHPTATSEKSATVHLDSNHMNAYSTNMPSHLRERQVNRDGSIAWTPYDWFTATFHDGDYSAATREINGRRAPLVRTAAGDTAPTTGDDTSLNLPADFWRQRSHLIHIHTAAQAAGCSPDALLIHALARTATFIHPCFKLPGVEQGLIGKHQTFDFLGCVVAETSGGKTLAAGVGELLIPQPDPPSDGSDPVIDFEQKVGSGEGIAEFFLVPAPPIVDSEGKEHPSNKRIIGKQALFMSVDEGTGFTNQAGRKGATIVSTLASAWSGESLGQLNAAAETKRLVHGGRVRVCAVINMQDTNGYKLYAPDLESVGFTGRLLFASAHDPSAPEVGDEPAWPGPLTWPIKAGGTSGNVYYSYADEIVREIKTTRRGILTKSVQIARRESQYLLLRCKVAAILASWEGRMEVSNLDWQIATQIIDMSSSVLSNLDAVHTHEGVVNAVTAAAFKLDVGAQAESLHVQRLAIGWGPKVLARLKAGPRPWKGLKDIVDADYRTALRAHVDEMVASGVLVVVDGRYEIGR